MASTYDYIGNFVYENGILKMIYHPEGVIRPTPPGANNTTDYVYDYFIKDYLGNVRAVITEENTTYTKKFLATMEEVYRQIEEDNFDNINETAEPLPTGYPLDGSVEFNERIAELSEANGTEMGPSMVLPVRKGDKVSLSTRYFYTEDAGGETYDNVDLFVNEILMPLATSGAGVLQLNEATLLDIASGNSEFSNAITNLLSSSFDTTNVNKPHAYLVWMLYDNNMRLIPEGSGVKQVENPNELGTLLRDQIPIVENGYLHAYVSNGSNKAVNFDNFKVTYLRGQTRQINHYYPYGLSISGLGGNYDEYLNKYTSKELQTGEFDPHLSSGLEMFDFGARFYDPALGRWFTPDPAEQFANPDPAEQFHNPYLAMGNNPVMYQGPDGEFIIPAIITILMLTTDVGFDIQKAISPVALHVDLNFGSHANGIGLDVSVGVPQIAPINYRYDLGATYYFNRPGGYGSGWQVRNGAEWGVGLPGLQLQYGGMRYRDYSDGELLADQVVHTAQIGNPLLNIAYSNDTPGSWGIPIEDWVPWIPTLRKGITAEQDRYRTASGRARVGLFELGFFLHTGEAEKIGYVNNTIAFTGGNINDPNRSNGIAYLGFAGFRMGWDSEGIRHFMQNRVAHDHWSSQPQYGAIYPWVLPTKRKGRFVFQFGMF